MLDGTGKAINAGKQISTYECDAISF